MKTGDGKNLVTFYYDHISPWSYIALHLLKRYEQEWDLDISLRPISLGYVFQAAGNRPPLVVANKRKMLAKEFKKFCDYYKLPVSPQCWTLSLSGKDMPPDQRPLMAFVRVLQDTKPEAFTAVTFKLFDAVFADGNTPLLKASEEDLVKVLVEQSKLLSKEEVKDVLEKSKAPEMRKKLQAEAKEKVEGLEMFGVPWMHIEQGDGTRDSFMGSDRFELIANWLGKPYYPAQQIRTTGAKL